MNTSIKITGYMAVRSIDDFPVSWTPFFVSSWWNPRIRMWECKKKPFNFLGYFSIFGTLRVACMILRKYKKIFYWILCSRFWTILIIVCLMLYTYVLLVWKSGGEAKMGFTPPGKTPERHRSGVSRRFCPLHHWQETGHVCIVKSRPEGQDEADRLSPASR